MPSAKPSTLCLTRQQGQKLIFSTMAGEKIVVEFKKCKHLRTEVSITMDATVGVTRGELLSSSGK